ncbi:aminoglycoside phosphotransferase family protein [Streptomyces ipomoeae]|uniref:Aminoglycoside phosphotransferase family protein n=1 Tax=Streptomyces ipomoeae TaxID=103232 RepID=A0AAE9AVA2_9ACTN|nr:aminoglycoside phosphotransferase family protein [Streptomyces ipomoeae]MDX2699376.1 aminoglycoside phosphotransferase family protein [Streptomyces ipomoeae]MDX2826831.1 aminoglycoside phosphotransferase family protein [Streptomyces ipomoeae]MDX2841680.1 aminoglycoside phosphotransferase family protein [Streptomyces ipomoeae]MDX2878505.1 aminoglycoside phosphotransferase family protein [Streptomyces ipomoeae]TQE15622.1 aminoglycoside phosphotransferase family protein [Streptomyces ipomoeae]
MAIRAWPNGASEVLAAVRSQFRGIPECSDACSGADGHVCVPGRSLAEQCPGEKPVDSIVIQGIGRFLAGLHQVRKESLPRLPADWPRNEKDSRAFLMVLARRTEARLRQANWTEIGGLLAVLGVPADGLRQFVDRIPSMARRPYGLLHTALGRDKVIVLDDSGAEGDGVGVVCVSWKSAAYGDPVYGLVRHIVSARYPERQWGEVIDAWADPMRRIRAMAVSGLARDHLHYVGFERARAAYIDVVRATRALGNSFDEAGLRSAAERLRGSLELAADPLRLVQVPTADEIERALCRWQIARLTQHDGTLPAKAFQVTWDERVPERKGFSRELGRLALIAEGAAPAEDVFKGTAHLNTVVSVPDFGRPVVVRRKAGSVPRLERGFLSEHAVLNAIERLNVRGAAGPRPDSPVKIQAPTVLALGYDHHCQFAIHTYEGPSGHSPEHPVHGLLPREADQLVDQLGALARVDLDGLSLDPAAGSDFYDWLCHNLVRLVDELPDESKQAASLRGLPDGPRLKQILGRFKVTARTPVLLHGDLNPWNLVRNGREGGLTIIDWEMAMIGDPLYDLVRHLHLTPTRPDIRNRMLDRWERTLPADCVEGWRKDQPVYRWIELVRSAYVDLDRLVTGAALDTPNVRRAIDTYPMTLAAATGSLGLPTRSTPS